MGPDDVTIQSSFTFYLFMGVGAGFLCSFLISKVLAYRALTTNIGHALEDCGFLHFGKTIQSFSEILRSGIARFDDDKGCITVWCRDHNFGRDEIFMNVVMNNNTDQLREGFGCAIFDTKDTYQKVVDFLIKHTQYCKDNHKHEGYEVTPIKFGNKR